jgi:tetratricopeptide (TPR) repeat protein
VPGHIYVAFELDMTPAEARKSALPQEDLIYAKDKVWVPVEVTSIKDGFLKAWQAGAKEWRDASARGTPGFNTFAEASARFAPVGFTASSATLSLPEAAVLSKSYAVELKILVDREIATQLAAIQAEIAKNKEKPGPLNKLGVLYARYGLTTQAETQFSAALKLSTSYVPALVNLGNLAFLKGEAKAARQYYEKAQKKDPNNPSVLLGIARVNHARENYGEAKDAYDKLKALDASLAARFSYLDLRGSDATKTADVAGVARAVVWDEE